MIDITAPKRYLYKVYDNGQFLGCLPKVTTDFAFSQDINTGGSQITVKCALSIDTSATASIETLTDESGATLTDESGNTLTTDGLPPLVGIGTNQNIIRNGNEVQVWEYGYYHPNGICMFRGSIGRWTATFGGDDQDDTVTILIYSDGQDLNDHIVRGSPFAFTTDQSQTSQNTSASLYALTLDVGGGFDYYGQTFTTGSGVTNVAGVVVYLNGTANVTVTLYSSPSSTTPLGSTTQGVSVGSPTAIQFNFPTHITVSASTQYFFAVTVDAGNQLTIYYQTGNPYAGGQAYSDFSAGGGAGGTWTAISGGDLYFQTISSNGSTVATYTSVDPTTGCLEPFMNDYIAEGGNISWNSSTIQATGLSLTIDFQTNTTYEGIQQILSISPDGFYYYVDLGQNLLYFKQANTVADIVLTKGLHMNKIEIVATIEYVINTVLTIGGQVAGSNIFTLDQDGTSVFNYGIRLDRHTDSNITTALTAHAVGSSEVQQNKDEQYQTVVSVLDKTMDITTLKLGMVIGFEGFGTFVDSLLAQIVHIDYTPNAATLTLGIIPKKLSVAVEQTTRGLVALNTIANPSAPS